MKNFIVSVRNQKVAELLADFINQNSNKSAVSICETLPKNNTDYYMTDAGAFIKHIADTATMEIDKIGLNIYSYDFIIIADDIITQIEKFCKDHLAEGFDKTELYYLCQTLFSLAKSEFNMLIPNIILQDMSKYNDILFDMIEQIFPNDTIRVYNDTPNGEKTEITDILRIIAEAFNELAKAQYKSKFIGASSAKIVEADEIALTPETYANYLKNVVDPSTEKNTEEPANLEEDNSTEDMPVEDMPIDESTDISNIDANTCENI